MRQNSDMLTAIGPRYTVEVRDIIMNPPAKRTLRAELIKRLSLSQEHKTYRLLEEIRDPHNFLGISEISSEACSECCVRSIAIASVHPIAFSYAHGRHRGPVGGHCDSEGYPSACISSRGSCRVLDENAEAKFNLQIAQLHLTLQQEMAEQLTTIRMSIEAIRGENRSRNRDRGDQRVRSRSHSRQREYGHSSNNLCWYHWRFGPEASQCRLRTTTGKRCDSSLIATSDLGHPTRRLFVTDVNTEVSFLIDTCEDLSPKDDSRTTTEIALRVNSGK